MKQLSYYLSIYLLNTYSQTAIPGIDYQVKTNYVIRSLNLLLAGNKNFDFFKSIAIDVLIILVA